MSAVLRLPGLGPDPWTRGISGERVYLRHPESTPITLATIAKALGQIPRFGGHTSRFYSVADHSVHVALILQDTHGRDVAVAGLMHDAHEAYTGDLPSPVKEILGPLWREFEGAWEARIRARFSLPDDAETRAAVKHADLIALATEMRQLMAIDDSRDIEGVEPDPYWDCPGGLEGGHRFLELARALGVPA